MRKIDLFIFLACIIGIAGCNPQSTGLREYLVVKFVEPRSVLIDGEISGQTGVVLSIDRGTHVIQLSDPQDYNPKSQKRLITGTTFAKPMEVTFEKN